MGETRTSVGRREQFFQLRVKSKIYLPHWHCTTSTDEKNHYCILGR
jgi:hypothetical protein